MNDLTLDEAKRIFFDYDCSHFIMGRENPKKYDVYMKSKIDKKIENEWREEKLELYYKSLVDNTYQNEIGIIFSKMYDQVVSVRTKETFSLMLKAIEKILNHISDLDKLMIAETIIGRKALKFRSGLIYQSFDIGEIEYSNRFAEYALRLVQGNYEDEKLDKRIKNVEKACREIIDELSLKVNV